VGWVKEVQGEQREEKSERQDSLFLLFIFSWCAAGTCFLPLNRFGKRRKNMEKGFRRRVGVFYFIFY
jgi:hypothetical protein